MGRLLHLADLPETRIPAGRWQALNEPLGITTFGVSAVAIDPGEEPDIEHDEANSGHQEVYVVVAGLVWNLFLTGRSMGYTPANLLLHVVVPALALVDWFAIGRDDRVVRWWQPIAWLAYPAAYGALAFLVLNSAGRRAPYYFLDPTSVGVPTVLVNCGLLLSCFLGIGYLLAASSRTRAANT